MRHHHGFSRGLVLLALIACDRAQESDESPSESAVNSAAVPATSATDSADAVLALDGDGLRVFLRPSGSARPIPFGEPRGSVIASVGRLQRNEQPQLTENLDCRATVATWPATGLQLWFSADSAPRFIGWSLGSRGGRDSAAATLTTASGVGIGSTRAELESAYAARIARSTLGVEFSAGELAGLLESDRPDSPIVNLWAGQVCLAR